MAHLRLLLVLLWAGVTQSSVVDLHKRIIGGKTCEPNERLYHVKLTASNGTHLTSCGGSLISKQWILTAAHCWEDGWRMTAHLGVHPGGVTSREVEITEQPAIFEDKDKNNNVRNHDIMLLKLPTETDITPVDLPDCKYKPKLGDTVQVAGHAATVKGPNNERIKGKSNTLQCADMDVVDCTRLKLIVTKSSPGRLYQHWFCGQSKRNSPKPVDTCPGDSGGGVVYNNKIYGVHCFTGDSKYACNEAAGFMDVCKYLDWIKQTTSTEKKTKTKTTCFGCFE